MPSSESPARSAWSTNENGRSLRERDEPERELGHLDGHRVLVDAVQAALGDEPVGEQLALQRVGGQRRLVGRLVAAVGRTPSTRRRRAPSQASCSRAAR